MSIVINGGGTVTGISTGGLPDGSVDADTLAANSVTAAKIVDGTIVDAEVTSLAASKLTGTIADARFPATLPAASGVNLTALSAGNLTGTVADARISALTSSKLSGAIPTANLPAGTVLQIVRSDSLQTTGTWTTNADKTIYSVAITPKSASSTLIVHGQFGCQIYGNGTTVNLYWRLQIFEGGTVVRYVNELHDNGNSSNTFHNTPQHNLTHSLTSNSTNARTYHLKANLKDNNVGRLLASNSYNHGYITVTEIA